MNEFDVKHFSDLVLNYPFPVTLDQKIMTSTTKKSEFFGKENIKYSTEFLLENTVETAGKFLKRK